MQSAATQPTNRPIDRKAELILVLIVMARSVSYPLMKIGIGAISPFNLMALRFLIAFAAAFFLAPRRIAHMGRQTFFAGCVLGVILYAILALQAFGLKTISSSGAGFIASTTVAFVPLLHAALTRKRPPARICLCAAVSLLGIAMISFTDGFSVSTGSLLYLLAAVLYAVHILFVERFQGETDAFAAGIWELGVAGALALVSSFCLEKPRLPATPAEWGVILSLAFVCSIVGLAIQPQFQRRTTPERYGFFCGMAPVFSALYGYALLGEQLGWRGLFGGLLTLAGVVGSGLEKRKKAA